MVLVGKRFACVKIAGRANFNVSIEFKTLLTELWQKGFHVSSSSFRSVR